MTLTNSYKFSAPPNYWLTASILYLQSLEHTPSDRATSPTSQFPTGSENHSTCCPSPLQQGLDSLVHLNQIHMLYISPMFVHPHSYVSTAGLFGVTYQELRKDNPFVNHQLLHNLGFVYVVCTTSQFDLNIQPMFCER